MQLASGLWNLPQHVTFACLSQLPQDKPLWALITGVRAPQKIQVGVSDTPTFWYTLMTCNWSSSSVNLFNAAVTNRKRLIFSPHNTPKPFDGRAPLGPSERSSQRSPRPLRWL